MNGLIYSLVDASDELILYSDSIKYLNSFRDKNNKNVKANRFLAQKHFRNVFFSLFSSLDNSAELIALFFTGQIKGLKLGDSKFKRIEDWLKRERYSTNTIMNPYEHFLDELFHNLKPLIETDGPEKDWLPFMKLLRNKAAHLGDYAFRYVVFEGFDNEYYLFIPKKWPYIWEKTSVL